MSHLMVASVSLVARGQGVHVWVVDQGTGTISPGESLVPDAHMVVRDEFWPWLVVVSLMSQIRVDHAHGDGGQSHQQTQFLPQLVSST